MISIRYFRMHVGMQSLSSEGLEKLFFWGLRREGDGLEGELSPFGQSVVFMYEHLLIEIFI